MYKKLHRHTHKGGWAYSELEGSDFRNDTGELQEQLSKMQNIEDSTVYLKQPLEGAVIIVDRLKNSENLQLNHNIWLMSVLL